MIEFNDWLSVSVGTVVGGTAGMYLRSAYTGETPTLSLWGTYMLYGAADLYLGQGLCLAFF